MGDAKPSPEALRAAEHEIKFGFVRSGPGVRHSLALAFDAFARERVEPLRECLQLMRSHLGHQDQDANHEWMAKKMADALCGRWPSDEREEPPK